MSLHTRTTVRTSGMPRAGGRRRTAGALMALVVVAGLAGAVTPALADGTTWTLGTPAADLNWRSVAYGEDGSGNGLWVAIATNGTGNQIMSSPDGSTWTPRTTPTPSSIWTSVAYGEDGSGNGLWVAVALLGTSQVMTSPDGITWTPRTAAASYQWNSVAYGNGRWVAVADSGAGAARVMTSTDGITWTIRTAASDRAWFSVAYGEDGSGNGLWVAIAGNGTGDQIMSSPDGITWTTRTSPGPVSSWTSVAYGDGLWVAVANFGGHRVMTSPDGITWTSGTPAADRRWNSVAYGNGLWVAVAGIIIPDQDVGGVMTSPDGITWTSRTPAADLSWASVAFGGDRWVAVAGGNVPGVMTSGALRRADSMTSCVLEETAVTINEGDAQVDVEITYAGTPDGDGDLHYWYTFERDDDAPGGEASYYSTSSFPSGSDLTYTWAGGRAGNVETETWYAINEAGTGPAGAALCSITVTYGPDEVNYDINIGAAAYGSASASPTSVTSGGSSILTATANSGYTFGSWNCTGGGTLDSTTDNPATLSGITANATCTPSFVSTGGSRNFGKSDKTASPGDRDRGSFSPTPPPRNVR